MAKSIFGLTFNLTSDAAFRAFNSNGTLNGDGLWVEINYELYQQNPFTYSITNLSGATQTITLTLNHVKIGA